jgi:GH25 family lysozyme M1 (1,4-beta-N-acetylmuramidase)
LGVRIGSCLVALVAAAVLAGSGAGATYGDVVTPYAAGVDVSHWQGAIDWTQVVTAVRFVIAKATEGKTLVDPTYPINRTGAESTGLRFGAYHFARPAGSGDAALTSNAIAQADFFLSVAQPQRGELPPALDLETKGALGAAALQTWTAAWLAEVRARTGVSALVYASPNFWRSALSDSRAYADGGSRLWIAHWTKNTAPLIPGENWGGLGWTVWQWTNCVKVPGFAHCVDGDRFNGPDPSAAALPAFPSGAPAPSTPPTVVGGAQAGKLLAGVPGTWSGGKPVTFSYQWTRCDAAGGGCAPIPGATLETYTPAVDDVGHALVLAVSAQTAAGIATTSSPATVAVGSSGSAAARPAATSQPQLGGSLVAGQTLTATAGTWTGSPKTFAYQWGRCDAAGNACAAIVGATASSYTLTPGDIGATLSLVVTATGNGGSASSAAPTTAQIAAAPLPTAALGSAVAEAGAAGAVASTDGEATVTWQPGAVPVGSTVTLGPSGSALVLGLTPSILQLPWPVDVAYAAAPAGSVVGYSTDAKVWRPAPQAANGMLAAGQVAGTTIDASGLLHVLLRAPGSLRLFVARTWGDPTLVAAGLPSPRLVGTLHVHRLRDGSVRILGRVVVPSQARVVTNVVAKTSVKRTTLMKPGSLPLSFHISRRGLPRGAAGRVRVAATDPYGRHDELLVAFRVP